MVYCTKCGTLNPDNSNICSKCGAPLQTSAGQEYGPYWRHRRYQATYHHRGAGFGALIFGVIILLAGLSFLYSEVYGISFPWWPLVLILIGIWLLFVAFRRNRRW